MHNTTDITKDSLKEQIAYETLLIWKGLFKSGLS